MEAYRVGIDGMVIDKIIRGDYGFDNAQLPALWF